MGKKVGWAFFIIIVIALAIAGFVYLKDRAAKNAADEAALREREAWQHKKQLLEKKIGGLEKGAHCESSSRLMAPRR